MNDTPIKTSSQVPKSDVCLEMHHREKESMIFKDEEPSYLVEYAKNKLIVSGFPSHMYVVSEWKDVKVI